MKDTECLGKAIGGNWKSSEIKAYKLHNFNDAWKIQERNDNFTVECENAFLFFFGVLQKKMLGYVISKSGCFLFVTQNAS